MKTLLFLTFPEQRLLRQNQARLCLGRLNQAAWSSWQLLQRVGQATAVACRQGAMSRSVFTAFVAKTIVNVRTGLRVQPVLTELETLNVQVDLVS
jgi:hypothetical protein